MGPPEGAPRGMIEVMPELAPRPEELRLARTGAGALLGLAVLFALAALVPLVSFTGADVLAVAGGMLAAGAVAALVASATGRASLRRFRIANQEAMTALARGELERAARIYQPWTEGAVPAMRCLARHNLAAVRARQGDLRGAIALLVDNESGTLGGALAGASAAQLALCLALAGELERAEAWREEADRRLGPGRAVGALARAVIECRRGRMGEAARGLERVWAEAEGHLRATEVRPLAVVRAFAVAGSGGPRAAGVVDGLVAEIRPRYSGEFDWLATAWPEMGLFLAAYELSGRRRAGAAEVAHPADRSVRSGG